MSFFECVPHSKVGWFFKKNEDNTVTVVYHGWHIAPSFSFTFDDAESANIFWEMVYSMSVGAEHDPYITDDASGWNMRNLLTAWYKRDMKGRWNEDLREMNRQMCAFVFQQPFMMRRPGR